MEREPGAGGGGGRGGRRGKGREERKRRRPGAAEEGGPASQPNRYDTSSSLLAVRDDDRSSAASGMDVVDRLTYLEQRMQMQEDEIQLLKMALADVLKRLNISEEQQAAGRRPSTGLKAARPVSLTLPSRPPTAGPSTAPLKKNTTLPSASRTQNYTTPPATSKSAIKSPTDSVKDSPSSKPKAATCKKPHDSSSKTAKEPGVTVGSRRVTHCKDLSEPPHKKDWVF